MSKSAVSELPAKRRKSRHYAVQALYQWQVAGQDLRDIELQFQVDHDFSGADVEYFNALLHGVPASLDTVEAAFEAYLDRKLDELDPVELTILRIGSFELLERIDVPYKVVINEAVNLSKRFGATDSHRYVNGVLDKVAQQHRQLEAAAGRAH